MQNHINLQHCTTQFNFPLAPSEIPRFRAAIAATAGMENELFHNHKKGDQFHYRYPLIQYKAIDGKAALTGINEGVTAIKKLLLENSDPALSDFNFSEKTFRMAYRTDHYRIYRYLALNEQNYQHWLDAPDLVTRIRLLESTLAAHVLKFCSAIHWQLPQRLEVSITDMRKRSWVRFKGVKLLAFDLSFQSNITLPPYVGLGKAVSHGFGWQMPEEVAIAKRKQKGRKEQTVYAK